MHWLYAKEIGSLYRGSVQYIYILRDQAGENRSVILRTSLSVL